MKSLRVLLPVAMLALLLAACGDSGDEAATTAPPTSAAATTTTAAATTTTAAATTTTAAATTTTADSATTTVDDGGEEGRGREIEVIGLDEAFSVREIEIGEGEVVTIIFNNKDTSGEPHNIHVRTDTDDWFTQIAEAPDIQEITFSIDAPGEYAFFCDTHQSTMNGTIIVGDGM